MPPREKTPSQEKANERSTETAADASEAGRKLSGAILADAPQNVILDGRERSVLATACAQADQNAALAETLNKEGVTVLGAAGQGRLNARPRS